jgi:uncharacterized membrane protein YkvA (DUF1232 family)
MAEARYARRFHDWTSELTEDVEATFSLTQNPAVKPPGRRYLAGALSYLLTQLDIIPDHIESGAVDDAFVLRVAYGLAAEHAGDLDTKGSALVARMTNEEDEVRQFLGDTLFAKLRRQVVELADKPVRGRSVDQMLEDARARADMKRELDQVLRKLKPVLVNSDEEGDKIERQVTSYFQMKLGG